MHTAKQLSELSKCEKNARKRIRLLAISHFVDGHNRTQIAKMLKTSRRSVNNWVTNYLSHGLAGLESKKPKGKASYLSVKQKQILVAYIEKKAKSDEGGRLNGMMIHHYIKQEFSITYHQNAVYKLLKNMGFSWITSRSRHPQQDEKMQTDFKKTKI